MTDFDYENLQKKRTAQGAFHKKGGSKSKRCTMPSDYLTPAQKKKLNGPTHELNLNQPLTWAEYKCIPTDSLKKTYLLNLMNTYKPSAQMLHRMFGCAATTVTAELRRQGLPVGKKGIKKPTKEQQAMWEAFCNGVVGGGDNKPVEEPKKDEPQVTCYDIEAEELERAKLAAENQTIAEEGESKDKEPTGFADAVRQHNLNLCDPAHPDHVNARRCDDPTPVEYYPEEELADAILDAFNKACEPTPCTMSKLATTMTGSPEGVVDNIRDLLSLFSGKVSVKLSIEVAE